MSLNDAPSGERIHIGFFGMRNAGKSSVVNQVCGQSLSVVSRFAGTTTDPVRKAMELLPLGPVLIIDTPGIDDEGDLGLLRVEKARQILRRCDIAVLVVDASQGLRAPDRQLLELFGQRGIPHVIAWNKADLLDDEQMAKLRDGQGASREVGKGQPGSAACDAHPGKGGGGHGSAREVVVSAMSLMGMHALKMAIAASLEGSGKGAGKRLVADLLEPGDAVVLVIPIDSAAPKGRIILPQQMVLRDVLDASCTAFCCQPDELAGVLANMVRPPKLVIIDSQAFAQVSAIVPENVLLTSFSILMARYKGQLEDYAAGAAALARLKDGDAVLVSEGCTHHRQCDDIGTVKLPAWIEGYSGAKLSFDFTSGGEFPDDLSPYALVAHCGACMLNEREVGYRLAQCRRQGVPVVNYGLAIAQVNGILDRSLELFPSVRALFEEEGR